MALGSCLSCEEIFPVIISRQYIIPYIFFLFLMSFCFHFHFSHISVLLNISWSWCTYMVMEEVEEELFSDRLTPCLLSKRMQSSHLRGNFMILFWRQRYSEQVCLSCRSSFHGNCVRDSPFCICWKCIWWLYYLL